MLRGINVSGQKKINMEKLKRLYESLDLKNVRTYIQSGNVIFECHDTNISKLTSKIEEKIKQSLGFSVVVLIRTKKEFQQLIENNPFYRKGKKIVPNFMLHFYHALQTNSPMKEIEKVKSESEGLFISGKEIYLFCPNGYGKTKLSNNFFEKKLNVSATTRNWKTVNKLFDIAK